MVERALVDYPELYRNTPEGAVLTDVVLDSMKNFFLTRIIDPREYPASDVNALARNFALIVLQKHNDNMARMVGDFRPKENQLYVPENEVKLINGSPEPQNGKINDYYEHLALKTAIKDAGNHRNENSGK